MSLEVGMKEEWMQIFMRRLEDGTAWTVGWTEDEIDAINIGVRKQLAEEAQARGDYQSCAMKDPKVLETGEE